MDEKTKNYLGWVIIAVLIIGIIAFWRMAGTYADSVEPGFYRSFSVTAEGGAVGVPDVAEFSFRIITEGDEDIAALQETNTSRLNAVMDYLEGADVDEKDITTLGYSLDPRYQDAVCRPTLGGAAPEICPPPRIVGYTVRSNVEVKVREDNFENLGDILSGVITAGANSVSQLNFTIDDPVELENEARAEAFAKAEAKARSLAEAGDFRLGRLLGIDEGFYPGPVARQFGLGGDMMAEDAAHLSAPIIEPGSQEVNVSLTLRYEIR